MLDITIGVTSYCIYYVRHLQTVMQPYRVSVIKRIHHLMLQGELRSCFNSTDWDFVCVHLFFQIFWLFAVDFDTKIPIIKPNHICFTSCFLLFHFLDWDSLFQNFGVSSIDFIVQVLILMTGPLKNKNRYDKNWTDPMVKEEENNSDKVKEFKLLF